jgi:hypothetical protein
MKGLFRYRFTLVILMFQTGFIMAQKPDSMPEKKEIVRDQRVDLLVSKHIQVNQALKTVDGFRIQLFSDSGNNSKMKAQGVLDEFTGKYPQVGGYLSFKSPNYRVRVGDFRTRLDAQRFLNELQADYPNAFIITDQINLPKPD